MVTGKRAFQGKSQASLISSIMSSNPPAMSGLQTMTPPGLDQVIRMCLEKDPDDRWQAAHDLAAPLKWIAEGGWEGSAGELAPARLPSRARIAWGLAVLAAALVTGITVWSVTRPGPRLPTRFAVTLPPGDQLMVGSANPVGGGIALSADGRDLVYVGNRNGVTQLYRRSMNQRGCPGRC